MLRLSRSTLVSSSLRLTNCGVCHFFFLLFIYLIDFTVLLVHFCMCMYFCVFCSLCEHFYCFFLVCCLWLSMPAFFVFISCEWKKTKFVKRSHRTFRRKQNQQNKRNVDNWKTKGSGITSGKNTWMECFSRVLFSINPTNSKCRGAGFFLFHFSFVFFSVEWKKNDTFH